MRLLNYKSIIDSSTENFRSKHLISDEENRLNLCKLCNKKLRKGNSCQYDVNHAFSVAVSAACGELASERLELLAHRGSFPTNDFDNLHVSYGDTYSETNTTIVHYDKDETVLLHISQGDPGRRDLRFIIEKKRSVDFRTQNLRWKDRKIFHYES